MEAESSLRFVQDVSAAAAVHPGNVARAFPAAAGMLRPSMGALLAGFGMAPSGMFLHGRPPAPSPDVYGAGANAPRAVWNGGAVVAAEQQPRAGSGHGERAPAPAQKGPWTAEEDDVLREMVREHGDRKWAVVARYLPGRIGKQCRERWTNHLRPDIKKSLWTEEDDLALIEAHKVYGNRWSMIARFLPGRSENSVKNHWNATRRSLKAKRRLKKKRNAAQPTSPPGVDHCSVLEEYIRGVYPAAAADPTAPSPSVSPPSYNLAYGDAISPPPAATAGGLFDPMAAAAAAAGMGIMMYHNPGASGISSSASPPSSNAGTAATDNVNNVPPPLMLDLNAYYGEAPLHAMRKPPPPAQMMMMMFNHHNQHQQQHQASSAYYTNLLSYPSFFDSFTWQPSSSVVHGSGSGGISNNNANNAGGDHHQYYESEQAASGGGGGGRDDDADVVQMASREFLTPSPDEMNLNLARFM